MNWYAWVTPALAVAAVIGGAYVVVYRLGKLEERVDKVESKVDASGRSWGDRFDTFKERVVKLETRAELEKRPHTRRSTLRGDGAE